MFSPLERGTLNGGAAILLRCEIKGLPGHTGTPFAIDEPGWGNLQSHDQDFLHDNAIIYTWCIPYPTFMPGFPNHIRLLIASGDGGRVSLEAIHVLVDANWINPGYHPPGTEAP